MTRSTPLSRRLLIAGSLAASAAPALAAGTPTTTPIARLWAEALDLGNTLTTHREAIAEAAARAGDSVPGWMRLGGEANRIAEARYGKLVEILNATPQGAGDLAIIAKVSIDPDIAAGARHWASEKLAAATLAIAA